MWILWGAWDPIDINASLTELKIMYEALLTIDEMTGQMAYCVTWYHLSAERECVMRTCQDRAHLLLWTSRTCTTDPLLFQVGKRMFVALSLSPSAVSGWGFPALQESERPATDKDIWAYKGGNIPTSICMSSFCTSSSQDGVEDRANGSRSPTVRSKVSYIYKVHNFINTWCVLSGVYILYIHTIRSMCEYIVSGAGNPIGVMGSW